ncbi:MAG: hypothetical protein NVS2B16_18420 [Chloroflexota bacterium]
MSEGYGGDEDRVASTHSEQTPGVGLAVALAVVAALGAGIAVSQLLGRRLSKPEIARLKFYKYLRERGHLES